MTAGRSGAASGPDRASSGSGRRGNGGTGSGRKAGRRGAGGRRRSKREHASSRAAGAPPSFGDATGPGAGPGAAPDVGAKAASKRASRPRPDLRPLVEAVGELESVRDAMAALGSRGRAALGGLWGSSLALVAAAFVRARRSAAGRVVILTPTVEEAEDLARDLALFGVDEDDIHPLAPVDARGGAAGMRTDARLLSRNLASLRACRDGERGGVMLVPLPAAARPVVSPDRLDASRLDVRPGQEVDRDDWLARLEGCGLERADIVASPGDYGIRGEIVDVWPYSEDRPYRIELFGDEIDSVRRIDPSTQRSIEVLERASIPLVGRGDLEEAGEAGVSISTYFGPEDLVIRKDRPDLAERAERYELDPERTDLLIGSAGGRPRLELASLPVELADDASNLRVGAITAEGSDLASALGLVGRIAQSSRRVLLFCQSDAEGKRFRTLVKRQLPDLLDRIEIVTGDVACGFRMHDLALALVDHHELFHRVRAKRREMPEAPTSLPIDDHLQLAKGELVVHVLHGIARYRGLERMKSGEAEQEFLKLEFADARQLYLPIAKIGWIDRYVGAKGREPRLSKLGGTSWTKRKKKVEDSVTEFAAKLLRVMAVRSSRTGFSFPTDTEWQHEFEAAFPYKDTPDQHDATTLVKQDMESASPMDRLICGDVGYGKTEIAMRAAFKAVESGKQVGVLVPTTVLAQQHLQTFRERMSDYPVEIDVISRFRTGKEIRAVLERTANGHVDILIGTHRLLQKDVVFKDLGLVIVDEEQRFGVGDKERLMAYRMTVDLLTLTATPIPRTLHMALVSLRDISTLETPPQGRQPIHTSIVPWQDDLVADAIRFELERDGQVFFIHNRVKTIEKMKLKLEALAPMARIEIVHGQMDEHLVEERMTRFVEGRIDLLLATTIIESGLDIPNANTLFIDRADRFGLAELHQLRGRVGRYKQQAYAYLLVPPRAVLSTDAKKRLKAIEDFSDLGSGFRIAMRDLEIRGSGNLLGAEQHGHIAAVGYELYCRLLRDAVRRLKGEKVAPPVETDIDFGEPAFLPADYVPDTRQKVEIYQKLSAATGPEDLAALGEECRDRFGPLPAEVRNLFEVARARMVLQQNRVEALRRRGSRLILDVPVGWVPEGLAHRTIDEVRRVDGATIHLLLPAAEIGLAAMVRGLERALRGERRVW